VLGEDSLENRRGFTRFSSIAKTGTSKIFSEKKAHPNGRLW
jgi:hypothetical protein